MNKPLAIALAVVGGIVVIALIFGAGMMAGRSNWGPFGTNPSNMMGNGSNMMGYRSDPGSNVKPLTVDQAKQAVEGYLNGLNNPDLELKEIMIFDNNAYARITEKSTGTGAMELLVDPVNLSVFPEYGPNMMWNLKYGPVSGNGLNQTPAPRVGQGSSGGMMGGGNGGMTLAPAPRAGVSRFNANPGSASTPMTVTSDQAAKIAQQYLDQQFPGYKAATDPDPFYGYYTIDIMKDDKPTGMLSVNGFSGQIFLHTWHGTFIEVSE
jgi:hypothetical protein